MNSVARVLAWFSVKLPEIWTALPKDVKLCWPGRVMGAEMTCPSRSMPMMAWNCFWARVFHSLAPSPVRLRLTVHWPLFWSWALADLTAVPVMPAGPSTYRCGPAAVVPGRSTVAFLSSLSGEVDL